MKLAFGSTMGAVLGVVVTSIAACSSFTEAPGQATTTDAQVESGTPSDGGGGDVAIADAAFIDAAAPSCAKKPVVVTESFGDSTLPPQAWLPGDNSGGSISRDTTNYFTAPAALKAIGVPDGDGIEAQIEQNFTVSPASIDVRFAVKLPATATDVYAEVGCSVRLENADNDYQRFLFVLDDSNVGVRVRSAINAGETAVLNEQVYAPFAPGWHQVREVITLTGDNVDFTLAVTTPSGTVKSKTFAGKAPADVNRVELNCGIDHSDSDTPVEQLEVFLDDISIDICPR